MSPKPLELLLGVRPLIIVMGFAATLLMLSSVKFTIVLAFSSGPHVVGRSFIGDISETFKSGLALLIEFFL